MFRTLLISAAGAGLAACLAVSAVQAVTTTPLIHAAEAFESAAAAPADDLAAAAPIDGPEAHTHAVGAWAPADGIERMLSTALANLVLAVGIALVLLAGMSLAGRRIDGRSGLLWGIGGFFAAALLPALGLPPELPGTPAADILLRQGWWLFAAASSAAGIAALALGRRLAWRAAGLALIVLPHAVGAPAPPSLDAAYPALLASEFVTASLIVSALLWSTAGLAAGWLHRRLTAGT